MKRIALIAAVWSSAFSFAAEPERDIAYDTKHERDVLDFWPAVAADGPEEPEAPGPAPAPAPGSWSRR